MRESRTTLQIEADKLDADVFRLVNKLDRFASDHRSEDVREMADILDGMRHRVRQYMHPKDMHETTGGSNA